MSLNSLVEAQQLSPKLLMSLFKEADEIRRYPREHKSDLAGQVLATLFYEPSTRTRLSFESAMLRLGGSVLSTENAAEFSSAVKGESIEDTIRVIGAFADCIVIRHFEEGAAMRASEVSDKPIINAGDGKGQHPTQALLDVYTIYREIGRLDNVRIALVGDLASGRTVRSLCYLLGKFENVQIVFVAPENLQMADDIKDYLTRHNTIYTEERALNHVLPEVDVVYMTRIQKERISWEDYEKARGVFVINRENFALLRKDARILHPLPHVEEIDLPGSIENGDDRVAYFRQVENGLYVRMALLNKLLKPISH